jgi:dephospho-CoA kinase
MENKIIIGLVGRICAGKGTVSEYMAKKYSADVLSYSDPLRDILRILHLPVNRENLQTLSKGLRQSFGEGILSVMIKGQAEDKTSHIIVLDPIRRSTDIEAFDSTSLITIGVTREDKDRYDSMCSRNREKSDSDITWEKFHELDNAESETEIDSLVGKANYSIENNGTIEELVKKVDEIMVMILKK